MQEITIIVDDQGGILVETDDDEQQFATAAEALDYVRSLLPAAGPDVAAEPAAPAAMDEQAMWDEEAAARTPLR